MAYFLECKFCAHRVEVADPAAAPATQCPECLSFYTLFPVKAEPRSAAARSPVLVGDLLPAGWQSDVPTGRTPPSLDEPPPAAPAAAAPAPAPRPWPRPITPRRDGYEPPAAAGLL